MVYYTELYGEFTVLNMKFVVFAWIREYLKEAADR